MRTAVTRALALKFLRATALVENSIKSDLQLTQTVAVSGEETLQREQVCMAGLLGLLTIVPGAGGPAKVFQEDGNCW